MVCDHTSSSFIVDMARFPGFTSVGLEQSFAVMDLFVRMKGGRGGVGTCPGAIQFTRVEACVPAPASRIELGARAFGFAHQVSHVNLLDGTFFHGCGYGTKKGKKNQVNGRCRFQNHMRDLFLIDKHLKRQNLDYVLTEGAMLSAYKFRRLMPWDYDIDIFIYLDDWSKMDYLTSPTGFKAELAKDKLHWSFVRAGDKAIVFKARRDVDIDTYFIVMNTKKTYKANTKLVLQNFVPYAKMYEQDHKDPASRQQRYTMHWLNVVDATPEERARTGKQYVAPTADIWVHGQWMGIRRYGWQNQFAKYGGGPSLLHVTRAMGKGVGDMFEGKYGEKALTYKSQYCDDPSSTGCLDGWVWFESWEQWYYEWKPVPRSQ